MGWAYAPPLILGAAIEHRIFDLLADGAKTAAEVSRENGASLRGVREIMTALVGFELIKKDDEGGYSLPPESAAFLVRTNPGYLGGILRHGDQLIPRWLHLSEIVKTGKPAMAVNQEGDGSAFFVDFVEDLFPVGYPSAKALAAAFPQARKVLDVAAGSGVWSIPLAQNSKEVRVTALDWPGVLPATRRVTERMGVAGQYEFLAGDLNSADLGNGYDLATLGQILHSEGETHSRALLGRVFQALAPGGTIAIAEFIANEDRTGPPLAMLFAVNMLVNTEDGDTFTVTEISQWLREAGFVDPRTMEVPAPSPLILASKPK
jgi:ubiquinone/menaquinone biosynthesis C-methylase UbiE